MSKDKTKFILINDDTFEYIDYGYDPDENPFEGLQLNVGDIITLGLTDIRKRYNTVDGIENKKFTEGKERIFKIEYRNIKSTKKRNLVYTDGYIDHEETYFEREITLYVTVALKR